MFIDLFCQIVFNSCHWFQRKCLKFLIYVHKRNWPHPSVATFFLKDQICIAIFVNGHPVTISVKSF